MPITNPMTAPPSMLRFVIGAVCAAEVAAAAMELEPPGESSAFVSSRSWALMSVSSFDAACSCVCVPAPTVAFSALILFSTTACSVRSGACFASRALMPWSRLVSENASAYPFVSH